MKIRLDKDWHECMDLIGTPLPVIFTYFYFDLLICNFYPSWINFLLSALQTVAQDFEGRYAKRKYGDTTSDPTKESKKKRKTAIVKKVKFHFLLFLLHLFLFIFHF